jgi:hypothetical protein
MAPDQVWLIDAAQATAYTATVVCAARRRSAPPWGELSHDMRQPGADSQQRQLLALCIEAAPREQRPT